MTILAHRHTYTDLSGPLQWSVISAVRQETNETVNVDIATCLQHIRIGDNDKGNGGKVWQSYL